MHFMSRWRVRYPHFNSRTTGYVVVHTSLRIISGHVRQGATASSKYRFLFLAGIVCRPPNSSKPMLLESLVSLLECILSVPNGPCTIMGDFNNNLLKGNEKPVHGFNMLLYSHMFYPIINKSVKVPKTT